MSIVYKHYVEEMERQIEFLKEFREYVTDKLKEVIDEDIRQIQEDIEGRLKHVQDTELRRISV